MSDFWSWFIIVVALLNIFACGWLIRWTTKTRPDEAPLGEPTGHTWDGGDIVELNNPMPRWWLIMFYISIFYGLIYLALYPGLGNWQGILGWTQENQYDAEVQLADARYGPIYAAFAQRDFDDLAGDTEAMQIGQRLFSTYCAQCHGSTAKGSQGFPNLTDAAWLYGNEPDTIKASIAGGRKGMMPSMAAALGDDFDAVVDYTLSLSDPNQTIADDNPGKTKYTQICAGCHGLTGDGNPMLGAPRLNDTVWIYGGHRDRVAESITNGRSGEMPAFGELLSSAKIHVLGAYVRSLSK